MHIPTSKGLSKVWYIPTRDTPVWNILCPSMKYPMSQYGISHVPVCNIPCPSNAISHVPVMQYPMSQCGICQHGMTLLPTFSLSIKAFSDAKGLPPHLLKVIEEERDSERKEKLRQEQEKNYCKVFIPSCLQFLSLHNDFFSFFSSSGCSVDAPILQKHLKKSLRCTKT